jgi:hypothetical protein
MLPSLRGQLSDAARGRRIATCPPPRPGPATSPTNLACVVVDQAALYGLLRKVRDLGLPLISGTPTLNTMERPLSTDTKSATPAVAAGNRVSTTRIVGGAGLALAASLFVQNAVFFVGTEAPTYATPLGEVLAYHAENRGIVAVSVGLEAVKLPLLLLFVTGLHGLVQRRGGAGADWSRLAVAAGATLSALFALVITTHIAVVLAADGLAEPTPAFELVWQLHAAAFALALPALGATFIGAALATHASGLTRPWQRLLGVAGGSLLILAGAGNLAIADGSPLLFVGVAGFAAWLVWLVVTGLRLIRGQG